MAEEMGKRRRIQDVPHGDWFLLLRAREVFDFYLVSGIRLLSTRTNGEDIVVSARGMMDGGAGLDAES